MQRKTQNAKRTKTEKRVVSKRKKPLGMQAVWWCNKENLHK